jgi:hypothetical protein
VFVLHAMNYSRNEFDIMSIYVIGKSIFNILMQLAYFAIIIYGKPCKKMKVS